MKSIVYLLFILFSFAAYSQEVCNNGIDDDGDGLIDLNDTTDCFCSPGVVQGVNLIPNPSFEDYTVCPSAFAQVGQVLADQWMQVSEGSSDYFNSCNYLGQNGTLLASDGNGYAGFIGHSEIGGQNEYYEYLGTCLPVPMVAGQSYELTFDMAFELYNWDGSTAFPGPAKISIFGTPNCNDMPLLGPPTWGYPNGAPTYSCPDGFGGFVELGYAYYTPNSNWTSVTISFVAPFDVSGIAVGPSCDLAQNPDYLHPVNLNVPYFFIDNFNLEEENSVASVNLSITGDTCSNDLVLNTQHFGTGTYQWYYEGVAILGETNDSLEVPYANLGQGNYNVLLTQGNTCAVDTIFVPVSSLMVNTSADAIICNGESVNIFANGSSNINWNLGLSVGNSQLVSPNVTTEYIATVSDTLGCFLSDTILVEVINLAVDLGNDSILCRGESITLNSLNTPINGADYSWNTLETTPSITVNQSGTYSVEVTSGNCNAADTIEINFSSPIANFMQSDSAACPQLNVDFTDYSTSLGNIVNWFWDFGNGTTSTEQNPNSFFEFSGEYNVSLSITDEFGCVGDTTVLNSVIIYDLPIAEFEFSPTIIELSDPLVEFTNLSSNEVSWSWDFGNGVLSTEENPSYTYQNEGDYEVELTVLSKDGCEANVVHSLTVVSPFNVYVPNSFTPDGDEYNNVFKVEGNGIDAIELLIFNRWGELIFESYDINTGWDGTYNGRIVQSDMYVWKLQVSNNEGRKKVLNGFVNLMR